MLLRKLKASLLLGAIILMVGPTSLYSQVEFSEIEAEWDDALRSGDVEKVRPMLDMFPMLKNKKVFGVLPLAYAAMTNNLPLARLLLSQGADINMCQEDQATSLHAACHSTISSSHMVEFLVKNGADLHAKDQDGNTPLHWCRTEMRAGVLVQNGADITTKNTGGLLPIHVAAMNNFSQVVSYYLSIKPDILDALTGIQRTPLAIAVVHDHKESAAVLLQAGADTQIQDQYGLTPLHIACREDLDTFVKILLCCDPDLYI